MVFGAEVTGTGKVIGLVRFSRFCSASIDSSSFQTQISLCILTALSLKFSILINKSYKVVTVPIASLDCLDNSSLNFVIFTSVSESCRTTSVVIPTFISPKASSSIGLNSLSYGVSVAVLQTILLATLWTADLEM